MVNQSDLNKWLYADEWTTRRLVDRQSVKCEETLSRIEHINKLTGHK
jgi:hypothetical protein